MKQKFLFLLPVVLASCVSASRYDELQRRYDSLETVVGGLNRAAAHLAEDTVSLNSELRANSAEIARLRQMLESANQRISLLNTSLDKLASSSVEETRKYLDSLQNLQTKLRAREQRMNEIESQLHRRDSALAALKNTINSALVGFNDADLSVYQKEGKLYVSLSNRLLFATGKTDIDKNGKRALLGLAQALNQHPDINLLIEGHTDNAPVINLGQIKDNWDLSVMRATEVIRYLINEGKIDPVRITAAGRGEFQPVAGGNSPEARAQNRRTEIILTPKLDVLYDLLNQ